MKLAWLIFLCCGYVASQNDRDFGRFEFNFQSLLTIPRRPGGIPDTSNEPEDPPLSCPPRPNCPRTPDKFYYADGSCNNILDGSRGQAGRPHKRLVPPAYADGRGQPRRGAGGRILPSTRVISTRMQNSATRKSTRNTHLLVIFCQFITHDITNTPTINRDGFGVDCRCRSRDPACFNVQVPPGDRQFVEEGKTCLPVVRSQPVPDANCNSEVRQQQNTITPYLDAGTVYGASDFQLGQLLNQSSPIGLLKVGNLEPYGVSPPNAPSLPLVISVHHTLREIECPEDVHKPEGVPCFVAGDARANENPALASFHTLFVRMHNDLVTRLNAVNRRWSKTQLINTARLIMSAVTQRIMYKEFLPELLGQTYMGRFRLSVIDNGYWHGYDSSYDATTSSAFISAALRFGHTLVTSPLSRRTPTWAPQGSRLELRNSFFDSGPLLNTTFGGANSIMRGLCDDPSETPDTTFVDDLHNFLFSPEGMLGHDLLAINMQRGRDHGIPGYNTYREFCGLKRATNFSDFVEIPPIERARLRIIYSNEVDDVDLYIASLAETPVEGSLFGPTFSCILAYQFRDIKKGDRLWHENGGEFTLFTPGQLQTIRSYTMSRLICDSMADTRSIQPNPFQQPNRPGNARRPCSSYPRLDITQWADSRPNPLNTATNPEETAWFPANIAEREFTATELLAYLLATRRDDICEATLGSAVRTVNGNRQFRFMCPPGSIRGTDFPNVDASQGEWGPWLDASTSGRDDDESEVPTDSCIEPIAIQVFQNGTQRPARETGQVFRSYSVASGFVCRGNDQPDGRCLNYIVRYFCKRVLPLSDPRPSRPSPRPTLSAFVWTPWSNEDSPRGSGDEEILPSVRNSDGFCRNPVGIQGRTVNTHIPANETGDVLLAFSQDIGLLCFNSQQRVRPSCRNYEVRYLCRRTEVNGGADDSQQGPNTIPLSRDAQEERNNLCNNFNVCCN